VSDANEALRFARKTDAETFIRWLGGNPLLSNPRATEHAWISADGALGRQDEVVQPIRDEPISSSKWEALPVVSEEMVLAARRSLERSSDVRRAIEAALSVACPASDKGEEAVQWGWAFEYLHDNGEHDEPSWEPGASPLDPRRHKRPAFQYRNVQPLYARPSPGVSREEVARVDVCDVCNKPILPDQSRFTVNGPDIGADFDGPTDVHDDCVHPLLSRGEG